MAHKGSREAFFSLRSRYAPSLRKGCFWLCSPGTCFRLFLGILGPKGPNNSCQGPSRSQNNGNLAQSRQGKKSIKIHFSVGRLKGASRKVCSLPRKFVFLGFRGREPGMSPEFRRDVPDTGRVRKVCEKKKVHAHFSAPIKTGWFLAVIGKSEPIFGKGMRRSTFQWKKGVFSEKGWGTSVNQGFCKDFYRKGNSVKRFGPFTEPPDSENWKVAVLIPFPKITS